MPEGQMKLITLVVGVAVCLLADPWPFDGPKSTPLSNQPQQANCVLGKTGAECHHATTTHGN
nr:hypothetical protein [uncultured Mediterranean phage uvMED]